MAERRREIKCVVPEVRGCYIEGREDYLEWLRRIEKGNSPGGHIWGRALFALAEKRIPGYRQRFVKRERFTTATDMHIVRQHYHECVNCPARARQRKED